MFRLVTSKPSERCLPLNKESIHSSPKGSVNRLKWTNSVDVPSVKTAGHCSDWRNWIIFPFSFVCETAERQTVLKWAVVVAVQYLGISYLYCCANYTVDYYLISPMYPVLVWKHEPVVSFTPLLLSSSPPLHTHSYYPCPKIFHYVHCWPRVPIGNVSVFPSTLQVCFPSLCI